MDMKKSPLLNKGADVNVLMNDGVSPLCITSQKRHDFYFPIMLILIFAIRITQVLCMQHVFGDIAVLHSFYSIIGEM